MGATGMTEKGPSQIPPSYDLQVNYGGKKAFLMGGVFGNGAVIGNAMFEIMPNVAGKVSAQFGANSQSDNLTATADYHGKDFNVTVKVGNNECGASYLQSISEKLAVGAELGYMNKALESYVSASARYTSGKRILGVQLASYGAVTGWYTMKASEKLNLCADFQMNTKNFDAVASAGYEYKLRMAQIKGQVNSLGRVAMSSTEQINPICSVTLAAEVDYSQGDYKFGFGFGFGG
mmetsp:Transcript_19767/g.50585  ORF Transcript_19767/g.50585 Transcript_19767/m.50585 type:complete len:234 (+) Transcript_19767:329-1030(+)